MPVVITLRITNEQGNSLPVFENFCVIQHYINKAINRHSCQNYTPKLTTV